MTGTAWLLLALGIGGGAYSVYLGYHFYRHRERRKAHRRASPKSAASNANRRAGQDRRQSD